MGEEGNTGSSDQRKDFTERLSRARSSIIDEDKKRFGQRSSYGFGVRVATDLAAAIGAGFFIGWLLDRWLGTTPWLLLLFVVLGAAAGISNVMRAARSYVAPPDGDDKKERSAEGGSDKVNDGD